jgi:hypothetical protein
MTNANVFTPTINSVVTPTARATERHDALTVSSVAVIVYAMASVLHEGIGHGGACLAVGGVPEALSSMHFDCSLPSNAVFAARIVAAGGTIATLIGGVAALAVYRMKGPPPIIRYALWLFAAVNIMQGTGYFLFSGIGGVGDWATVIDGAQPAWLWRSLMAGLGFAAYYVATTALFRQLDPFIGEARPRRYDFALMLAVRPYLVGGALQMIAGAFNPGGLELMLLSGAAASFGGTSGLAWGPQMLRGTRTPSSKLERPVLVVRRSLVAIALSIMIGLMFIATLGPGLSLSDAPPTPASVAPAPRGDE